VTSRAPIRGITFDVDGTLYAPKGLAWPMFVRAFSHKGLLRHLRVGAKVRDELRGRDFADAAALLAEEARIAGERFDVPADKARALMDDAFDRVLCEVLAKRRRQSGATIARAVVDDVVARGIRIAAISDRRVDDKLTAMGMRDLPWAARISADDTGVLKPSPVPFQRALAAMGVAASEAAHVGDRDDTDGAGARAAGMRFVHVHGPRHMRDALRPLLDDGPVPK
jgi:FMN phosphatase YigB (HAD superfamily)